MLAEEALEEIAEEVLDLFKKEYISRYAYISNPQLYERTMQFRESWKWTELKKFVKTLSKEMYYDPSGMTFNPEKFQHGSKYSTPPDVRDNLMDILNKKGYSSSLWLSVYRETPYWDRFIADMFQGGALDKIIDKHFRSKGFIRI